MSKYVLAFRQSATATTPDAEQAWSDWFTGIGSQIADFGNRVGPGQVLGGPASDDERLSGYIVVDTDDLDAAAKLASGCPGLRAGGRVEVGTVIPAQ